MKNVLTAQIVIEDYIQLTEHKRFGLRRFFSRKYLREPDSITEKDVRIVVSKCVMKERAQHGMFLHFDKFGRIYTGITNQVSRTDKPDCEMVKWDEAFYIAMIRGDKKTGIFYSCAEWTLP